MGTGILALLDETRLLSSLLGRMQDGVSIIDPQLTQVYVNDAFCSMLGFARDELLGRQSPYAYWPPEEVDAINTALQRTIAGNATSFELVFMRKDGKRVEVVVAPSEMRDEQGELLAYFATVRDVSDQAQLRRSLAESEERWRSIAETPFEFVVIIDREYRYTYVNHTAPGITRESLIGIATPFDFVDPTSHGVMRSAFENTFATGRATTYDVYVPQIDAWYSSIVGPIVRDGQVTHVSILTREITEQKRAEETLRRSEQWLRESHKLETIGTLAGGIAHDLNNILTPVFAHTNLAQRSLDPEDPLQEHLGAIDIAGQRARDLVKRILQFSRRVDPNKTTFDLRDLVQEDIALLRSSMPASIELATVFPPSPVLVRADRGQLGQLLTNLATNALQSMQGDEGTLTITLAIEQVVRHGLGSSTIGVSEQQAVLEVADSGRGMDETTLRRVFEPFFTTKPVGSGTGLGLSIVHSVVREHGGDIVARSVPGQGATFTVRLPMAANDDAQSPVRGPSDHPASLRRLRVLCVDDEAAIVAVAQQALTREGHIVTGLTTTADALETFARDPSSFDVVVSDQSMPKMTGTSFIAALRAISPGLGCVLMTGLGDEATRRQAAALGAVEIIDKPFTLATLAAAVERAAERSGL